MPRQISASPPLFHIWGRGGIFSVIYLNNAITLMPRAECVCARASALIIQCFLLIWRLPYHMEMAGFAVLVCAFFALLAQHTFIISQFCLCCFPRNGSIFDTEHSPVDLAFLCVCLSFLCRLCFVSSSIRRVLCGPCARAVSTRYDASHLSPQHFWPLFTSLQHRSPSIQHCAVPSATFYEFLSSIYLVGLLLPS